MQHSAPPLIMPHRRKYHFPSEARYAWRESSGGTSTERLRKILYFAAKSKQKDNQTAANVITIDEVGKVQLKTAVVLSAEKVKDADKLLLLKIQLGDEERQIVSGIAEYYKPEELVGKTIVVIANLKPAILRGIESNGMLLAAKKGKTLRLVTTDGDIASGASVG